MKNIYKINSEEQSKLDFATELFYSIRQKIFLVNFMIMLYILEEKKKLIIFQINFQKDWKELPQKKLYKKIVKIF